MRKICIVTGSRAEYGLLHNLMNKIKKNKDTKLQTIATCMHLLPKFGLTYKEIIKDGFKIILYVDPIVSLVTVKGKLYYPRVPEYIEFIIVKLEFSFSFKCLIPE